MASPFTNLSAFRTFEHAGWESIPTRYHDAFGDLTTQAIEPLLAAVDVRRGVRMLDVATGPGYVAAAAAQRGANVVGVDFSAAMVAEARRRYPAVTFQEGDAEELPFPDNSKLGFTVWAQPEEAVGFGMVLSAIQNHGSMHVPLPPGPPFFRFSDPAECRRTLLEAGFVAPEVMLVPQTWRLRSPDALLEIMQESTVRTAGLLRAQTSEALQAIRAALRDAVGSYQKGDTIELPMPAVLATAIKR
jgi:SAM-dependent methyltransferase